MLPELPMQDIEAERYVLGSILRNNSCMDEVTGLTPEDFSQAVHQEVFREMQRLSMGNHPIDPATIGDALSSKGLLETESEATFAGELMRDDYTTAKIGYHAKIVKRHSIRRRLKQAAYDILREVQNPSDPEMLLDMAEQTVMAVREKGADTETKPLQHFLFQTLDEIDAVDNGQNAGLTTGLLELDRHISMRPGQLIVVGARPGGGKSIAGLQFGIHNACHGNPVVFYSLEMSGEELSSRAISAYGSIDADYITRKRKAVDGESDRLHSVTTEMSSLPLLINERPWNTINGIVADARRMKKRHDVKLVVVDYLQLVQSIRAKGQLRYEQLGEITQSLKHLAKELKVPVILLAQLNRDSEKNGASKEPELWHIKESGSAEQDADIVLLLWTTPKEVGEENMVHVKVAKNRQGMKDVVINVNHAKQFMRFETLGAY